MHPIAYHIYAVETYSTYRLQFTGALEIAEGASRSIKDLAAFSMINAHYPSELKPSAHLYSVTRQSRWYS